MPIVSIHYPSPDPATVDAMLAAVRDTGAQALQCPPSNVWVVFHAEADDAYMPGRASKPVIVIVRANAGRSVAQRTAFATAVSNAVAAGLAVPPGEVWIHYQEMNPQDIWFEGRWSG